MLNSLYFSRCFESLLMADFVEKVGHRFHVREVRALRLKSLLWRRLLDSDFTQQRVKKAFSPANIRAIWANRRCQHNRPIAASFGQQLPARISYAADHRTHRTESWSRLAVLGKIIS